MCPQLFILLVLIAVGVVYTLSLNSAARDLLTRCGGRVSWRNDGVMDVDGKPVSFVYRMGNRKDGSSLQLAFKRDFHAQAVFRTETQADRFGKEIGMNQEIQLYDPDFDRAVYVECEDPAFIDRFLSAAQAKEQLRTLLGFFTSFEIRADRCVATKFPCGEAGQMSSDEIVAGARTMLALAAHIPSALPGQASATPRTDECRRAEATLLGFGIGCMAVGVILTAWGFFGFEPLYPGRVFKASLYVSLPLAGLFVFYILGQFKGISTALRMFSLTAVLGGGGIILLCWGGFMVLNGGQDLSSAVTHEVRVVNKHVSRGKSTSYRIWVTSWVDPDAVYKFETSRAGFDLIDINDPCVITTRSGLFDFEWITSHVCGKPGDLPQ